MGPFEKITGFEWDKGNEQKNVKHGVTPAEAEQVFLDEPVIITPMFHIPAVSRDIGRLA